MLALKIARMICLYLRPCRLSILSLTAAVVHPVCLVAAISIPMTNAVKWPHVTALHQPHQASPYEVHIVTPQLEVSESRKDLS